MSYTPGQVPSEPDKIAGFLTLELQALARAFTSQEPYVYLQTMNVAPTKPRDGLIVKADGTHWNPGSGAGVYCYYSAAWHFLG